MVIAKTTFNLKADSLVGIYAERWKKGLNNALQEYERGLIRNTPEDSGEMVRSYKQDKAVFDGTKVSAWEYNDAEHAIYIEYGVWGKKYNYHKPKGVVFFSGVWNRTFQRTLEAMKDNLFSIVRSALKW